MTPQLPSETKLAVPLNARYDNGGYYCWLIERRRPHNPPDWWNVTHKKWETNAEFATWFAKQSDAELESLLSDRRQYSLGVEFVVCEHGFMLAAPSPANAEAGDVELDEVIAWLEWEGPRGNETVQRLSRSARIALRSLASVRAERDAARSACCNAYLTPAGLCAVCGHQSEANLAAGSGLPADDLRFMLEHFEYQAKQASTRYLGDRYDRCRTLLRAAIDAQLEIGRRG